MVANPVPGPDEGGATGRWRFLLDEDMSPRIAVAARGLGLDVVEAREVGLGAMPDDEILRWSAAHGRLVVTRNRDDFIEWTTVFFQRAAPHAGVLIVSTALSIQRPERVAHALSRWSEQMAHVLGGRPLGMYYIGFLGE